MNHEADTTKSWLGVDFSGDYRKWGAGVSRSNVWIARIVEAAGVLQLDDVFPVQELPGIEPPFNRLAELLRAGDFEAAAIDAPFSLPGDIASGEDYPSLLKRVGSLDRSASRPFAEAARLIAEFLSEDSPQGKKIYRDTEQHWRKRGVNVRSTMWAGPRGGAAMTVACMRLLLISQAALWPWTSAKPLVAEAFPAAQLRHWGLPHQEYAHDGATSAENRRKIIGDLQHRLVIAPELCRALANSADALDAVLCGLAATGLTEQRLESTPTEQSALEGWIAVRA